MGWHGAGWDRTAANTGSEASSLHGTPIRVFIYLQRAAWSLIIVFLAVRTHAFAHAACYSCSCAKVYLSVCVVYLSGRAVCAPPPSPL